jgi:4-hydroxybenzoate polyprenyltransferase
VQQVSNDVVSNAASLTAASPQPNIDVRDSPAAIVADMDGTLLNTDAMLEALVALLCRRPLAFFWILPALRHGRAAFKRALARAIAPDFASLPANERLLDWLGRQKAEGHRLLLFSASDQSFVDAIARRFPLFDCARGSDGATNLSGANKYSAIAKECGPRFIYAGDSPPDLIVWKHCGSAVLCGDVASLHRKLAGNTTVVAEFPRRAISIDTWRRALRLHQWAKNALVFVPLVLSGQLLQGGSIVRSILSFVALGFTASATYLVNDLFDLDSDRRHRSKRFRPLASGELPLAYGICAIPLLLLCAAAVLSLLPAVVAKVAALYLAITLAYSMRLKREPILDLLVLAGLFTIRILAGIVAVRSVVSPWLLAFSMLFFGSLATIKRYTECAVLASEGRSKISGRGYRAADAPWLMAMGAACGYASVLVFVIYLVDAVALVKQFRHPVWLWTICPTLGYWIGRTWLLAARGEMRDDPIVFALKDRLSLLVGAFTAICVVLALL